MKHIKDTNWIIKRRWLFGPYYVYAAYCPICSGCLEYTGVCRTCPYCGEMGWPDYRIMWKATKVDFDKVEDYSHFWC
jgi:hypothetical protein